jgi:hypothetical protein
MKTLCIIILTICCSNLASAQVLPAPKSFFEVCTNNNPAIRKTRLLQDRLLSYGQTVTQDTLPNSWVYTYDSSYFLYAPHMGSDRMNSEPTYYVNYFNKSDVWEYFHYNPEFQVDYSSHTSYFASNGSTVLPSVLFLKTYDVQDRVSTIETLYYDNASATFYKTSISYNEYDTYGNVSKHVAVLYDSFTNQYLDTFAMSIWASIAYRKDTLYDYRQFKNGLNLGWFRERRQYNQADNLVKFEYYYNYDTLTTDYKLSYSDTVIYFTDSFLHIRLGYDTFGSPPFLMATSLYKIKNGLVDSAFHYGNNTGPTITVGAYDRNANGRLTQYSQFTIDTQGVITPSIIHQFTRDFNDKVTRLRNMGFQPNFYVQDYYQFYDSAGKILKNKYSTLESRYHYEKYDDGILPAGISTASKLNFQVFPIPASDKVYVLTSSGQQSKISMCVYDLNGICIKNEEVAVINGDKLTEINLDGIATGAYLLVILQDKQRIFSKNIIKR